PVDRLTGKSGHKPETHWFHRHDEAPTPYGVGASWLWSPCPERASRPVRQDQGSSQTILGKHIVEAPSDTLHLDVHLPIPHDLSYRGVQVRRVERSRRGHPADRRASTGRPPCVVPLAPRTLRVCPRRVPLLLRRRQESDGLFELGLQVGLGLPRHLRFLPLRGPLLGPT